MMSLRFSRPVPAQALLLTLAADVAYGAPIQAIANASTLYSARSRIAFAPEPHKAYVVKGELSTARQSVWLEEVETGRRVGVPVPAPQ
jgi:hypothetical protein